MPLCRYYKCKDQEEVEYVADGAKIGKEMRYKGETTEFERRGDGIDEPDWDSLSARVKRRTNTKQPHRYRGKINPLQYFFLTYTWTRVSPPLAISN